MEIQDYAKLAYQNEFGPKHLAGGKGLYGGIQTELEQLSGMAGEYTTEKIGNGLSRISLCGLPHPDTDAFLLSDLMLLTIEHHKGSMEGLKRTLKQMEIRFGAAEKTWLDVYRADGCPPISHSEAYRNAYRPHYRVLKTEYVNCFSVLSEIGNLLTRKHPVVISIDGRCGSGKTSLAALIENVFPCKVFHMDDYYLPPHRRSCDWENVPAGNMDLARFKQEVLLPAKEGLYVISRPFDCQARCFAKPSFVPPARLTVIEGSYSQHPMLADQYDWKLFLTCEPDVQKMRLEAREGAGVRSFYSHWIPMEERYFSAFDIEKRSDLVLDTGCF